MKPPSTSSALADSAARAAEVPVAAIIKAAGVTRQAVRSWGAGYGQGHALTVATGMRLASLPVQRPRVAVGFQNSAIGPDLGFYAARSYSLRRPPRTGRRRIRFMERSAGGWSGRGGRSWRLR